MESFLSFLMTKSTVLHLVLFNNNKGTNGIIVSKKILASIGIGILIFVILSVKVNNAYADVNFTDLTWPQFAR